MYRFHCAARAAYRTVVSNLLLALATVALLAASQSALAQNPAMPPAGGEEAELPHPFFTHMGLPEGVGNFNLRLLGLATRAEGRSDGDFAFHLETGLTKSIGLHVRSDRFLASRRVEAMFQFAAYVSKDGMSGFAPLIEFEIPTQSGTGSRVNTMVGFTTALVYQRVAFNQVVHYDPREDGGDASAALVFKLGQRMFPVVEVLGEGASGMPTVVNLVAGMKVRLREGILLGFALQFPLTDAKEFSGQGLFGPDFEWTRQPR